MIPPDPLEHAWWLSSRAAGIVALLAMTASVGLGLAMAGRAVRRPWLHALHQQTALVALVAIAVHGICLLGDAWLKAEPLDLAVPFRLEHARTWTALGVIGGWLAAVLGLSYWLRGRIGPARWRTLHRATLLAYVLSVLHTLGAGSDAGTTWMRVLMLATVAPVLFLLVVRLLPPPRVTRRFRVAEVVPESASITSFVLEPADRRPAPRPLPGQFVTVHPAGRPPRSYSVSGPADGRRLRISVKREPGGAVSEHLHATLRRGTALELSGPGGGFVLDERGDRPVLLLSAGVGATPLLAMLHRLAATRSPREVWWVHSARDERDLAFAAEVDELLARLPRARRHVRLTARDGRLDAAAVLDLGVPADAEAYLCGPPAFLDALEDGLRAAGLEHVRSERFGAAPGPRVTFRRSGVEATFRDGSLLELAEANAVPVASGCRAGACGACRVPVVAGDVRHDPEPAAAGEGALLCCARPEGDVVLDA